jgi:hypothetical protein
MGCLECRVKMQEALSSIYSHAGQNGSHAIRRQTLVHAEHLHPHIYIRACWPGNLILSVGLVASRRTFRVLNPAIAVQLRARPFAKFLTNLEPSCWVRRADATYVTPLATAQPDCPLAEAATYMPGVFSARQQVVKQRHGPKVAGAL